MSSPPQPSSQQRSLYRRHRPRTFDDVVGQESVVRTLRNAVELDRVHHAYLFVGSRGTGKTSLAKILAACLNCERGRTPSPCGTCESCRAIAEARSLDVIEMDAASHNSVEDIRDLRDSVAFQPLSGRAKVYILDEAHMLSNAAWNAFLKTLEEPPPSTVFVMATTEAQKVPATVIDRCHRFDFQRPAVDQVATVIGRAAQAESIAIPPEAVAALAKSASGSFRDALGALEQIVTYGGPEVSLEDVLAVLGVADSQLVQEIVDAVAAGDARGCLLAIERCVNGGRDLGMLASEIEGRCRELIVVQVLGHVPKELALTPDHDERLGEQARRVDLAIATRLVELLGFAVQVTKAGGDARTQLELALLKAARPEVDPSMKALLARIERLERSGSLTRVESPAATEPEPSAAAEPITRAATQPEPAPVEPTTPAAAPAGDPTLHELDDAWPAIVTFVREGNALLGAVIAESTPCSLRDGELTIGFPKSSSFNKRKAESGANKELLAEAVAQIVGRRLRLQFELREQDDETPAADSSQDGGEDLVRRIIDELEAEELPQGQAPAGSQTQEGG